MRLIADVGTVTALRATPVTIETEAVLPSATVLPDATVTVTAKLPELSGSSPIALTVPLSEVAQPAGVTVTDWPRRTSRTWVLLTEVVTRGDALPDEHGRGVGGRRLVAAGEVHLEQPPGVRRPQHRQPT